MTLARAWRDERSVVLALACTLISLFLPVGYYANSGEPVTWLSFFYAPLAIAFGGIVRLLRPGRNLTGGVFLTLVCLVAAIWPLLLAGAPKDLPKDFIVTGIAATGLWLFILGLGFLVWRALSLLSEAASEREAPRLLGLLVPGLFGAWLIYLWQVGVTGFGVPSVLLPSPALIAAVFMASTDTLWADFYQTFLKSVLAGYALGCGSGFLVALLVDRVPFLQRGLLPLGNFVSALPIVGVAPIMVMWFGFDWQSKAAVVVIMTFFPMLVNTIAGLHATAAMERDLMRSYAANYLQTLVRVRLPNALPFLFNALKINSTLALIGAIVAEFFGTPIVGMGFRISTEIGRMNVEMVWATIVVAAVAGSLFYGLLALTERATTFWHPSYRQ